MKENEWWRISLQEEEAEKEKQTDGERKRERLTHQTDAKGVQC